MRPAQKKAHTLGYTMVSFDDILGALDAVDGPDRGPLQQQAEQQLKAWEVQPGYHYLLQEVYLKPELPLRVRWMAIICFKNGVEKYWRASRVNAISKEEKVQIRLRLFHMLDDKHNQLTVQNAHAIARVVRFDFPAEWPTLFEEIAESLESFVLTSTNLVAANNLLVILNQIVKSVSMVRIGRARHAFQSKAPIVLPIVIKLYLKLFHMWTASQDLSIMEICYMCLKNIRRIIPEGFEQPHKNYDIKDFFRVSISHLQSLIMEHEKYLSDLLEKYVKAYSKLYVNLINTNPTSFVLMPSSSEIITLYMSLLQTKAEVIYNSSEESDFWAVVALKGFLILKKMVNYVYKQGAVTLKQRNDKEEVNNAIALLKSQIFTPDVIRLLCDLIINWYIRLKQADLESWLLEPEEWTNEELSTSWEYQVRPCAENFYQDLIKYFKDDLSDFILNKISTGFTDAKSVQNILTRDSTFCTFQLSADSIADKVNFDQLLQQFFIPEAQNDELMENKIIKRRICLIINSWVSVDCSRESRIEIYKLLLTFLQRDNKINDSVVKLNAVQTLRTVVNDWNFNKLDFQPYLTDFVALLIQSLLDITITESKLYVIDTLATLIERCNPLVDRATLICILGIVPGYWEKSAADTNKELILKASLLRALRNLVIALNQSSPETYSITIPLISSCCKPDLEFFSLLSEDGFDLWLAILQYYPLGVELRPEFVELFALVHPALIESTEILPTILSLARSYALLQPRLFVTEPGMAILQTLSGYIASMRDDAFEIFVSMMDILFLAEGYDQQFLQQMMSCGMMKAMLDFVMDDSLSIVLANKIFMLLSRLATSSPQILLEIISHLAVDSNKLLQVWVNYYKNNGNPRNKKVNLLALVSTLVYGCTQNSLGLPELLGVVLRACFLFMEEIFEEANGKCLAYDGDYPYSDIDNYAYLYPDIEPHGEKLRYQALLEEKDPVCLVNLRGFLQEKVKELRLPVGEAPFAQLMAMNDQYTNEKVQELL